ncbi:hypothetical protein LTR49_027286, partial [Elasticomyces elasticus]
IVICEATALIAAAHTHSFYSLKLQRGVPSPPVSIRASSDPIALHDKLLEQNAISYVSSDLVDVGKTFIAVGLTPMEEDGSVLQVRKVESERRKIKAERRVKFMAVEAPLREDYFETTYETYSYVVNRLMPSGANLMAPSRAEAAHVKTQTWNSSSASGLAKRMNEGEDAISWRAAFLAGRYRPTKASTPPTLRRLEQRIEFLSFALLLAPTAQLTDILAT